MTYDTNNVFAKIIRGEIPGRKVLEDDQVLAIHDIAAAAPVHVLVMPKGEYVSFDDFARNAPPEIKPATGSSPITARTPRRACRISICISSAGGRWAACCREIRWQDSALKF
jgi:hypothetical protein